VHPIATFLYDLANNCAESLICSGSFHSEKMSNIVAGCRKGSLRARQLQIGGPIFFPRENGVSILSSLGPRP
jgi:hypothetical protein